MLKEKLLNLREKVNFKIIKNFKFKKYTKLFSVLAILIIIGLALPSGFAHAGITTWVMENAIFPVIYIVLQIVFEIAYIIAWIGASILNWNLNPEIMNRVFSDPAIMQGWAIIRDICNLLFLLLLLLVALGTILQHSKYNIKNSLLPLILAIFLINFSNVIAGAIIDFGNILMYGILAWSCPTTSATCFQDFYGGLMKVVWNFREQYSLANLWLSNTSNTQAAIGLGVATVYTFIYGFILLAMAGFLLVRTAALALLIILSPFAYFGEVMPGMEDLGKKWWSNIWSYTLFGPIFALMLFISSALSTNMLTMTAPPLINTGLDLYAPLIGIITTSAIPLLFLLAIIPITKSLGLAGTDVIIKNTTGLGEKIGKGALGAASDTWGRYVARGAADERKGLRGGFRRALSNFSPTAWKQAYKAKQANDAHDYDVATGRQRNKLEDPFGAGKKYETWQHRNDPSFRSSMPDYEQRARDEKANKDWKDKGVTTKDEAVAAIEQGKKNGTMGEEELKIAVKFIAAEDGIDELLERSSDASGVAYGASPEELIRYVNDTFGHLDKEEKSKLLTNIAKSEDKNGNTSYNGLGISGYNTTTKRVEYEVNDLTAGGDYIDPTTDPSLPPAARTKTNPATGHPYTKKEWQEEQQVKAANKKDVKDLKKSNFIDKAGITGAGVRILRDMKGERGQRVKMMDRDRVVEIDKALENKYMSDPTIAPLLTTLMSSGKNMAQALSAYGKVKGRADLEELGTTWEIIKDKHKLP